MSSAAVVIGTLRVKFLDSFMYSIVFISNALRLKFNVILMHSKTVHLKKEIYMYMQCFFPFLLWSQFLFVRNPI